jgi:hypothetical protein
MTQGLIQKYATIRPHMDRDRINDYIERMGRMEKSQLDGIYAGTPKTGHAFLMDCPGEPNCVLETVMSHDGDSVSALYHVDPLFSTRAKLVAAREELIDFLNDVSDAPPTGAVMMCSTRNRAVRVKELTFLQLLDAAKYVLVKFHQ